MNNEKLKKFGEKLKFYNGIPEIFKDTKKLFEDNPKYQEYGIREIAEDIYEKERSKIRESISSSPKHIM